jgi:osmotically inducible protein OsmC
MSEPLYTATSTAWGGREGRAASSDGRLELNLSIPKGLGGDDGPGTNPEQLFATGYAACFHSALKSVARQQKEDVSDSAVTVTIGIGPNDAGGFGLTARIEAEISGVDRATAQSLLDAAHQLCPYSVATRGNVPQDVVLVDSE